MSRIIGGLHLWARFYGINGVLYSAFPSQHQLRFAQSAFFLFYYSLLPLRRAFLLGKVLTMNTQRVLLGYV